jgi:hypothetical protein
MNIKLINLGQLKLYKTAAFDSVPKKKKFILLSGLGTRDVD